MDVKSSRWVSGTATVAALLSVSQLFSIMSLSISRSAGFTILFVSSLFGFQWLYAFLADMLVIAIKRPAPERKITG